VEPLGVDDAAEAAERHGQLYFGGVAVDAVRPSDQYYRLVLGSCFFVAGMGATCRAESIDAADYMVRGRTLSRLPGCILTVAFGTFGASHRCELLCMRLLIHVHSAAPDNEPIPC